MKPYSSAITTVRKQNSSNTKISNGNYISSASISASSISIGTISASKLKVSNAKSGEVPSMSRPNPMGALYPTSFVLPYNTLHYQVWTKIQPYTRHVLLDTGGTETEISMKQIFTFEEFAAREADQWLEGYFKLFENSSFYERSIPTPPDGIPLYYARSDYYSPNGCEFNRHMTSPNYDALGSYVDIDTVIKDWVWLLEHCQRRVWHTGQCWAFECPDDRGFFLLKE